MSDRNPLTLWAFVSLASSVLGWLAFLALFLMPEEYGEIARGSAGVGIIWAVAHGLLAATICFLGIVLGIIALVRIRVGGYRGGRMAWTAIVLGIAPFAIAVVLFLLSNMDSNPLRR